MIWQNTSIKTSQIISGMPLYLYLTELLGFRKSSYVNQTFMQLQ